jgi:hypothetical protein
MLLFCSVVDFNLLLGYGALGGSSITTTPDTDIHFLREGEGMEFYKMEIHWSRTSHTKKIDQIKWIF